MSYTDERGVEECMSWKCFQEVQLTRPRQRVPRGRAGLTPLHTTPLTTSPDQSLVQLAGWFETDPFDD